jgi:hypothetical protein
MRFKKPKSLKTTRQMQDDFTVEYLKGNVLSCYRLRQDLPQDRLVQVMYEFQKSVFFANGATFAKSEGAHWLMLIGTLTHADAESLCRNLASITEFEKTEFLQAVSGASYRWVEFCRKTWGMQRHYS